MGKMALTKNSVFKLSKSFLTPSSIFIRRQVWKGGDIVTEDNKEKVDNKGAFSTESLNFLVNLKGEKNNNKETKEKATETAQEAWRVIEEVAGEMKQRVVPTIDSNKETDIQDEMNLEKEEENHTKNSANES